MRHGGITRGSHQVHWLVFLLFDVGGLEVGSRDVGGSFVSTCMAGIGVLRLLMHYDRRSLLSFVSFSVVNADYK